MLQQLPPLQSFVRNYIICQDPVWVQAMFSCRRPCRRLVKRNLNGLSLWSSHGTDEMDSASLAGTELSNIDVI